ncbi:MAG: elongation factor P [Armatimonadetes bacterium CG07_land_8_20_14_0_80_40_9]|nr:MAG: elongation factor P [Armatimonadetes bacterium CG07_land_8_20_14_0_80_40_9]
MTITTSDFRGGLNIELKDQIFTIVDFQHVKPGKGGAFVRCKLKNIRTGNILDKTFRAGERVEKAQIEEKRMQYLYEDDANYFFMDNKTFEQMSLSKDKLGEEGKFLKENLIVDILTYKDEVIGVNLPTFVELKVVETEPGVKGDTVSSTFKQAKLETGAGILVPLFINKGDILRIDTRSGEYVERRAK